MCAAVVLCGLGGCVCVFQKPVGYKLELYLPLNIETNLGKTQFFSNCDIGSQYLSMFGELCV